MILEALQCQYVFNKQLRNTNFYITNLLNGPASLGRLILPVNSTLCRFSVFLNLSKTTKHIQDIFVTKNFLGNCPKRKEKCLKIYLEINSAIFIVSHMVI